MVEFIQQNNYMEAMMRLALAYQRTGLRKHERPILTEVKTMNKTYSNSDASGTRVNVKDVKFFGDSDQFKLLCKASSAVEGWMKSTKAMEIPGVGCVVQVTTQQGDNVAEAVTFVPGCRVEGDGVEGRRLVADK